MGKLEQNCRKQHKNSPLTLPNKAVTVAGNNFLFFFQKEIVFDILHIVMCTLFILCKEIGHSLTSMITFKAQGALEKHCI